MSRQYTIVLEEDELTDGWVATVEELPGRADSQGGTIAEVLADVGEAIEAEGKHR